MSCRDGRVAALLPQAIARYQDATCLDLGDRPTVQHQDRTGRPASGSSCRSAPFVGAQSYTKTLEEETMELASNRLGQCRRWALLLLCCASVVATAGCGGNTSSQGDPTNYGSQPTDPVATTSQGSADDATTNSAATSSFTPSDPSGQGTQSNDPGSATTISPTPANPSGQSTDPLGPDIVGQQADQFLNDYCGNSPGCEP